MIDQIAPPAAPLAPPAAPPAAPQIKTVYQADADGLFVGTAAADPCPLGSGVWLIPAGCVEIAPPELTAGQLARWTGEAWAVEDIPAPPEPEPPPPPTLEEARATAVAAMARWIDGFLAQFVARVPAAELASWAVKADRARQHIAGDPQPMIAAEAALTGEDAMVLARTIVAKAEAYEAIISRVTGLRRATEDAIAEADTPEAVAAALEAARGKATSMAAQMGLVAT